MHSTSVAYYAYGRSYTTTKCTIVVSTEEGGGESVEGPCWVSTTYLL
jgi:hypothetical protein